VNETLVVRIWRPADRVEVAQQPLQGIVEHAAGAGRRAFTGDEELLAAIHALLEPRIHALLEPKEPEDV